MLQLELACLNSDNVIEMSIQYFWNIILPPCLWLPRVIQCHYSIFLEYCTFPLPCDCPGLFWIIRLLICFRQFRQTLAGSTGNKENYLGIESIHIEHLNLLCTCLEGKKIIKYTTNLNKVITVSLFAVTIFSSCLSHFEMYSRKLKNCNGSIENILFPESLFCRL